MEYYFIIENQNQKGPFSLNEIIEMNLSENTLVWKKGLKDWIKLKDLSDYKKNVSPPIPKTEQPIIPTTIEVAENHEPELKNKDNDEEPIIESELKSTMHNYAGFWLRLVAFFIDFALMFFITSFVWAILQLPIPVGSESLFSGFVFKNPLGILVGWLFYASFESSKFQATPGKAILGLKVTDDSVGKIGFGQASGRFFGKILSGLIIGIGYLMIGFTKNKQGLHDQMAHTYVLKGNIKEMKSKPTSWIIFSSAFVLFIISLFIPANTELIDSFDSFQNKYFDDNYKKFIEKGKEYKNFRERYKTDINKTLKVSFHGISFNFPENWTISKEVLQEELGYQIICEKKGFSSSEIISIIWINKELEPDGMIMHTIESMREKPTYKNVKTGKIRPSKYKNYNCSVADFEFTLFGETFFGRMTSFNVGENTVLMLKQSDSKVKLDSEFKLMEESFELRESDNLVKPIINSSNSLPINLHDKRNNVQEILGTPDRSGSDFETYYSHGLVVNYNNNQQVISIDATRLVSGITYDGLVFGVKIGDNLNKCIEEWGKTSSVKETKLDYDIYVWKLTDFYIECEMWNKTDYDSNFGNVTKGTVKNIKIIL